MATTSEDLVLRVQATQELLDRQLREMGRSVENFEQSADKRLEQLERRFAGINLAPSIDAVKEADKAFKTSFDSMKGQAAQLAEAVARTGQVDLTPLIEQARQRAATTAAEAVAIRELARADEERLRTVTALGTQEKAVLAAGRAAVFQSREKANAAAAEAARLEQLAAQMGQTAIASRQVVQSSGAVRAGMQQAGFQVQDFLVQVAGGTSAMRAFTLQGPQMFGALQLIASGSDNAGGKMASFARFLGGGWGVAIGIAIPLIGMLVERMFDVGDAADTIKAKTDRARKAIEDMANAAGRIDLKQYGVVQSEAYNLDGRVRELDRQIVEEKKRLEILKQLSISNPSGSAAATVVSTRRIRSLEADRASAVQRAADLRNDLKGIDLQVQARNKLDAITRQQEAAKKSEREGLRADRKAATEARKQEREELRESEKAAKDAARALDTLRSSTDSLIARYAPAAARTAEWTAAIRTLTEASEKGLITQGQRTSAELGAFLGYQFGGEDDPHMKMLKGMDEVQQRVKEYEKEQQAAAEKVKLAWVSAAQGVVDSLQYMANSIRSGDFLGILSTALSIFTQLGGIGAFGKTIQTNITSAPGRAVGGPVSAGQLYTVGERGRELFVPNTSGTIIPNSALRSPSISAAQIAAMGQSRAQVVRVLVQANDYFDARVDSRAVAVAAPLSMRAAQGGADLAREDSARRAQRRIPGRF